MLPFILHKAAIMALGLTALLACAAWQMVFSYAEQENFRERFEKNFVPHPRNVRGLTYAAKQKHMIEADLTTAKVLLRQALTVNPSFVPAWLSLAELENDLGDKNTATAILRHADQLTQGLHRWRWEKALTAYQLGRMEMLPAELSFIIRELDGKPRSDALQLAFSIWEKPEELLEILGRENIPHLLAYAVGKHLVNHAVFFWTKREAAGREWQDAEALALMEMLLHKGEVKTAATIWRKHFNPDKLLFDGQFSTPPLGQAFGWRSIKSPNFDLRIDKSPEKGSGNSIHYRFKGWDNINFNHFYQIVPVTGGKRYTLTAEMKAQKLTTNQRPFLELSGYHCQTPLSASEMVAANQEWQEHQVVLSVPEECAAIVVRLRRIESNHIDSKLAGQLWLRNVVLSAADDTERANK